jgi:hypothetical protein
VENSTIPYLIFVDGLSLGVSTVETNEDWDRDFSICPDQLLKPAKIFSTDWGKLFQIVVGSNPDTVYCMDVSVASYYIK